jgi:monothiol bacilliredoxin
MHWIHLTEEDQLQHLVVKSQEKPQIIFKYSPRWLSSDIAFRRLQEKCCPETADFYFLDIITYRAVSDKLCDFCNLPNESPQVILIRDGACIYEESHWRINADELMREVFQANIVNV